MLIKDYIQYYNNDRIKLNCLVVLMVAANK